MNNNMTASTLSKLDELVKNSTKVTPIIGPHFCPECGHNLAPYISNMSNQLKDPRNNLRPEQSTTQTEKLKSDKEHGMDKRLMNITELSAYLGTPKASIYTKVCTRKIPRECVVKLGRSLRFDKTAIDAWINSHRTQA